MREQKLFLFGVRSDRLVEVCCPVRRSRWHRGWRSRVSFHGLKHSRTSCIIGFTQFRDGDGTGDPPCVHEGLQLVGGHFINPWRLFQDWELCAPDAVEVVHNCIVFCGQDIGGIPVQGE